MDVTLTIIVGFGGAVVGAAAGFLGAVHIDRQRVHRTRVGMVRGLISELRQNGAAVIQVLYSGAPAIEFSSDTWRSVRFELGQFLNVRLYEDIDFVYLTLPAVSGFSSANFAVSVRQKRVYEEWLDRVKAAIRALLELPIAADFRESQKLHEWVERVEKKAREKDKVKANSEVK